jgi:hypothetical protein
MICHRGTIEFVIEMRKDNEIIFLVGVMMMCGPLRDLVAFMLKFC